MQQAKDIESIVDLVLELMYEGKLSIWEIWNDELPLNEGYCLGPEADEDVSAEFTVTQIENKGFKLTICDNVNSVPLTNIDILVFPRDAECVSLYSKIEVLFNYAKSKNQKPLDKTSYIAELIDSLENYRFKK